MVSQGQTNINIILPNRSHNNYDSYFLIINTVLLVTTQLIIIIIYSILINLTYHPSWIQTSCWHYICWLNSRITCRPYIFTHNLQDFSRNTKFWAKMWKHSQNSRPLQNTTVFSRINIFKRSTYEFFWPWVYSPQGFYGECLLLKCCGKLNNGFVF